MGNMVMVMLYHRIISGLMVLVEAKVEHIDIDVFTVTYMAELMA